MGSIKTDGSFVPKKHLPFYESNNEIYEYGNSMLALSLIDDCRRILKTRYAEELIAMSIVKALDPCPLRLMRSKWEKLYASTLMNPDLRPSHLSHAKIPKKAQTLQDLLQQTTNMG